MNWEIIQCCEPGKKHESSTCQDNCYKLEDSQFQIMVLCDGTSDAELSDLGSKWVAEFSANYFKKHFDSLYNFGFAKACEGLTEYHQQLLLYLSERANKENGINIVVERKINNQELRKYCTTVQVLAMKNNGKAIYYKVGNGSAILVNKSGNIILSDSSTESPTKHVTLPNTLSVLGCSDFQTLELNDDDDYDIILMTDGVEFSKGLFYNHEIRPEFNQLIELTKNIPFTDAKLRDYVLQLRNSVFNSVQDDIGISILHNTSSSNKNKTDEADSLDASMSASSVLNNRHPEILTGCNQLNTIEDSNDGQSTKSSADAVKDVINDEPASAKNNEMKTTDIQIPNIAATKVTKFEEKNDSSEQNSSEASAGKNSYPKNKRRDSETLKINIEREQKFLKKVMIHLLIAFIAGTLLGGISCNLMNSMKIDIISEKIDHLSEAVDSLSNSTEASQEGHSEETIYFDGNDVESHKMAVPANLP